MTNRPFIIGGGIVGAIILALGIVLPMFIEKISVILSLSLFLGLKLSL